MEKLTSIQAIQRYFQLKGEGDYEYTKPTIQELKALDADSRQWLGRESAKQLGVEILEK